MATGGIYSDRHLKVSVDSLNHCLSDHGFEETHRSNLVNAFEKLLMQQLQSISQADSDNTYVSKGEDPSEPLADEFSKLVKILNSCWISDPESNPIFRPQERVSDELLQQLLCFFLLDEGAVLTKKQLTYWWIGQGLINVDDGSCANVAADAILSNLIEAGTVEQVTNKEKRTRTSKYRRIISPSHLQHDKVGMLRKERSKQMLTYPNGDIIDEKSIASIEALFNRDVPILNITGEWVRQMSNLKVLHLGSCSIDKKSVQVLKVEFVEALQYLKKLRFISFKGISRIMSLADGICSVGDSLRVLDLQDCPNLEVLPKKIGKLQNLTHLDLSECYLLDRIPKTIISLTKLQVLEGFVISDVDSSSSCKFKDLASHLGTTLTKLSIRTRKVSFPLEDDMKALAQLEKLLKLKVVWVRISDTEEQNVSNETQYEEETFKPKLQDKKRKLDSSTSMKISLANTSHRRKAQVTVGLPEKLQKLHVEDIPQTAVNSLLLHDNYRLENLKKVYIIGGELSDLTNQGKVKWKTVETLKLKYLTKLHMSWMQWKASFPMVSHLEVVRCPFLTPFPCDHYGIWKASQDV